MTKLSTHDQFALPGKIGKVWWGFQIKNLGAHTIYPGMCVVPFPTSQGINTFIHAWSTTSYSAAERRSILGVAVQTIPSYAHTSVPPVGYIACGGFISNLLVTGTVKVGENFEFTRFIVPYTGQPGMGRASTAGDSGALMMRYAVAFDYRTSTDDATNVRAFVHPWRW